MLQDYSPTKDIELDFSLWPVVDRWETSYLFANYKGVLTTISHEIEQGLKRTGNQPRLFAGFQKLSLFIPQVKRYRRLARSAGHLWVFGIPDVIPPQIENVTYVYLTQRHALAKEWFIVVDGQDFFSALIAQDLSGFSVPDPQRQFRGVWTFDDELVHTLQQQLSLAIGLPPHSRKDIGPRNYMRHLATISQSASNLVDRLETRNQIILRQQQMQEELSQMLVHDLRNPLTNIIGSLHFLAKTPDLTVEESNELISNSLESGRRMASMISNILDVNKMEDGKFQLDLQPTTLVTIMESALDRWSIPAKHIGKQLTAELPETDAPLSVDFEVIQRVLDNLIGNAIKYAQKICFEAHVNAHNVTMQIHDNGPGIPEPDKPVIFDKYRQAQLGAKQRKGTGLGLTFSKMAVEGHSGSISVGDSPLGGAVFTVTLPLAQ